MAMSLCVWLKCLRQHGSSDARQQPVPMLCDAAHAFLTLPIPAIYGWLVSLLCAPDSVSQLEARVWLRCLGQGG